MQPLLVRICDIIVYHGLPTCIWRLSTSFSSWINSRTGGHPGYTFSTTYIRVDIKHYATFRAKVGKDGLKKVYMTDICVTAAIVKPRTIADENYVQCFTISGQLL